MDRAKELFLKYHGNRFYMDHDGEGWEYESYHVSKETEEMWTNELISQLLDSKYAGREALKAYSAAADLVKTDRLSGNWYACLYYPLKAGQLDDVTTLYMLKDSYRMAEGAVKKHLFTEEEADSYVKELDGYIRMVLGRAEKGEMIRSEDYVMQEFSDPVYVADYLDDLKKKWAELFS